MAYLADAAGRSGLFTDGDWILSENMTPHGGIGVIQLKHVGVGEFIRKDFQFISEETFKSLGCTEVRAGDVLISRMADPIGRACVVPKLPFRAVTAVDVSILRVDEEIADRWFVTHLCNSIAVRRQLEQLARGTTRSRITRTELGELSVPLPALEGQRRIASRLGIADCLRCVRRNALEMSEGLLGSVFLEMFASDATPRIPLIELVAPGRNTLVNGPFGSDLLTSELVQTGVPVIYIRDISQGRYVRVSDVCVTQEKAVALAPFRVEPGDVLLAKVGDPPGSAAIYPDSEPVGVVTQDVIRIRPNRSAVLPEYLAALFNSSVGRHLLKPIIVQGTRERFGLTPFKQVRIPIPKFEMQDEFRRRARAVDALGRTSAEALRQSEHLFQTLVHEAFGEGV